MTLCARCQLELPPGADACSGCGAAATPAGAVATTTLDAPLPAPMVEPILTPAVSPTAAEDCASHLLTRCLRGPSSEAERPSTPTVMTTRGTAPATHADAPPKPPPLPAVRPKLVVVRGQRAGAEFPVLDGRNTVGRFVDKPVDIDLLPQEADYQVWCSRLHAAVTCDRGAVVIEDLHSLNGTWVNGTRLLPGQPRPLKLNDVVQVGTVQLRLVFG